MKEITYQDIANANKSIKNTDIKGKEYAEVNQRIKAFRIVFPDGTISTEMISNENGVCIFKAIVLDGAHLLGVGHAYEKEGSTFINKTSYIENCETSAVGRALGMCGFGIDTSVASAEEVENAINNQAAKEDENIPTKEDSQKELMTHEQFTIISGLDEKLKSFAIKKFGLNSIDDLTKEQAEYIINSLKKKGVL